MGIPMVGVVGGMRVSNRVVSCLLVFVGYVVCLVLDLVSKFSECHLIAVDGIQR